MALLGMMRKNHLFHMDQEGGFKAVRLALHHYFFFFFRVYYSTVLNIEETVESVTTC